MYVSDFFVVNSEHTEKSVSYILISHGDLIGTQSVFYRCNLARQLGAAIGVVIWEMMILGVRSPS